jgi:hypothetical protein
MVLVIVGDVIGFRRVCEQPFALFESDSDHQRPRFGRRMRRQAGHERPAQLQYWTAVPTRGGFNVWQREAECLDDREVVATFARRATAARGFTHISRRRSDPRAWLASLEGSTQRWR